MLVVAHGRGVVHRDLKPSNIMVNSRRELIIMDFGLAWRLDFKRRAADQDGGGPRYACVHVAGATFRERGFAGAKV